MEDNLKKFVDENRDEFETDSPSQQLWDKLQNRLQEKRGRRVSYMVTRWAAAAVFVLICGAGAWYFAGHKTTVQPSNALVVAKTDTIAKQQTVMQGQSNKTDSTVQQKRSADIVAQKLHEAADRSLENALGDKDYGQLLFHYTALVKANEKRVVILKDISPELYSEFKKATDDLDALFLQLQNELPGSVDKQKVLKLMVENLQMQESILKKQLQLIDKVQQPANKKENDAYDNI